MDWKTERSSRWAIAPVGSFTLGEGVTGGFYHYLLKNMKTNDVCVIGFYGIGAGWSGFPATYSENLKFYYQPLKSTRPTSFEDISLRRAQLVIGSIQALSGQNASGFVLRILDGYSNFANPLMTYKSTSGSGDFGYENSMGTPNVGFDYHNGFIKVKWDEVERGLPDKVEPIRPEWNFPVIPYVDPPPPPRGPKKKVTLGADVMFALGRYTLRPEALSKLGAVAYEINKRARPAVMIEGHADATGAADFNHYLSLKRAEAVKAWFVQQGVVQAPFFSVFAKGESEPIANNTTRVGRAQNRRVEITID